MAQFGRAIYLERDYRNLLFSKAYENAGESLCEIAWQVGYQGRGRNGTIRDMWLGKMGVSPQKLERIAELAKIPIEEVLNHKVSKEQNLEIEDWRRAFEFCKNNLGHTERKHV